MENFKLLSNRLSWAVARKLDADPSLRRLSNRTLAKEAGVSPPAVGYWYADTNGMDGDAARRLGKFLGVDAVWLESGEGAPETAEDTGSKDERQGDTLERAAGNFVRIKMVELRLSAGISGFQTDPAYDHGSTLPVDPDWVRQNNFVPERLVAIRVKGESMETTLFHGDLIVVNTADTRPVDGAVFAVNYEGEAVVKRLARDAGDWWLTSDNPDQRKYHRKICRGEACILVGRVVHRQSNRI